MSAQQDIAKTSVSLGRLLTVAGGLVLAIGVPLYVVPHLTEDYFSWTVQPPLSAAFLGGAYLSAAVTEFGAARRRIWAGARVAVPAVFVFTLLTLLVTLGNLDRFHFDAPRLVQRAGTWIWLLVYVVVPPTMMVVLVSQLRRGGPDPVRLHPIPAAVRGMAAIGGAGLAAAGVVLLVDPGAESWMWPWLLTPLTGRAVGAWLVGLGVALAHIAWEADWWRVRPATASAGVFGVLQLVAVLRYLDEPLWDAPQTWVYMTALIGFVGLGLWGWRAAGRRAGIDADSRRVPM